VDRQELVSLTSANVPPRTIGAVLRERGGGDSLVMKDIYNARQRIRAENLNRRTPIQSLVAQMNFDDYVWNVQSSPDGHVTHLFFAHKGSLELYRAYPEVLLIDCTYKTNRFHMPLCNNMGITGIGTSFYVAFAFLQWECENDYKWVLEQLLASVPSFHHPGIVISDCELALINALSVVYPSAHHILCKWHIKNNVEAKCWPFFRDLPTTTAGTAEERWSQFIRLWDAVVESLTVSEF
jgi:hypothetical protein